MDPINSVVKCVSIVAVASSFSFGVFTPQNKLETGRQLSATDEEKAVTMISESISDFTAALHKNPKDYVSCFSIGKGYFYF
jgi:hypothetical protein